MLPMRRRVYGDGASKGPSLRAGGLAVGLGPMSGGQWLASELESCPGRN